MGSGAVKSATYRLAVRGELDERFAYLFNGLDMERTRGRTVLTGQVIDQAQPILVPDRPEGARHRERA